MRLWTAQLERADALLFGRVTYEMESAWRRAPVPEIAGRPTRSTLTPIAAKNGDARRPSPSQASLRTSPGPLSAPSRTADCELNPHGPSPVLTCGFMPLVGVQIGVGGPTPHRTTRAGPSPALLERWFIAA